MTAGPLIDYEALAQEAMRGVVRTVLAQTAKFGLVGDHHFYISFDTESAGVVLSKRLRERYPHEMTIVLQHRFWDLTVTEDRFEVKLTFDGIPERLVVPFAAIKVFFDPSVRYGLQFEDTDRGAEAGTEETGSTDSARAKAGSRAPRKPRPRRPKGEEEKPLASPEKAAAGGRGVPAAPAHNGPGPAPAQKEPEPPPPAPARGAEIVSLDAFRKK